MKNLILGLVVLGLVGTTSSKADELISRNLSLRLRQGYRLSVNQVLGIPPFHTPFNSLIVVASSPDGHGIMDVVANGRILTSVGLSPWLATFELQFIHSGAPITSIDLFTRGTPETRIALLGVTVDGHVPPTPPVPYPGAREFRGKIEDLPVAFSGRTSDELYEDCMSVLARSHMGGIDEIYVEQTRYYRDDGYWQKNQACAVVVMNSFPPGSPPAPLVSGTIEGTPFRIDPASQDNTDTIAKYVPVMVAGLSLDEIFVDGVRFYRNSGYWTSEEAALLITYSFKRAGTTHVARGTIESSPFVFSGWSAIEIREQCLKYMQGMASIGNVDEVTVNGHRTFKGSGYWTPAEVCMVVASGNPGL